MVREINFTAIMGNPAIPADKKPASAMELYKMTDDKQAKTQRQQAAEKRRPTPEELAEARKILLK